MLKNFFNPSSIAVVGASRSPGKVGYEVLKNIVNSGFKGKIHPVNPNAREILDLRCYSSVLDIEENIDLCIITVPAGVVPIVVEEIGEKGIKNLIIISSGFRECGLEGTKIENKVMNICRKHGIRVLGPNCLGIIDTYTPLNATFTPNPPAKGNTAFISQSGALGTAVLDWAVEEGVGFSKFISLGNKVDINETDLIKELKEDPHTKVILIYLEGLENGREFVKVAREVTKKKPVIALKSGTTSAGARAVSSHTGAIAGNDLAYTVAFKHAGVIRAESTEGLFNLAEVFSKQPLPKGPNLAIITNAGGPGILATDSCVKYGLKMAPINADKVERLRKGLPSAAGFFNPIDVLGDAKAERYRFALEEVLASGEVHSALIILTPQAMTEPLKTAGAIIDIKQRFPDKPVITCFMGGGLVKKAVKKLENAEIPNFEFPEKAVQALAALHKYKEYKVLPIHREIPTFEVDREKVASILKTASEERRLVLTACEAIEVMNSYGIPTPPLKFAATAEEAASNAEEIGYPVVLKIESPQILHKTDIGGVKLNLESSEEVRTSFYELVGRAHIFNPRATILGVNIQKMISPGKEMIVGVNRDLTFGPLLMFGLGGIYVNFLKDVSFRLAPLSKADALKMVRETKAYTLLRGIRGEAGADIESVVEVVLRVSQLVTDFEEITEMDINPLIVYERGKGCAALDIKITIKPR